MPKSAVQLTFPCPACGGYLSLNTFRATGPCPTCKTILEVDLSVHQRVPQVGQSTKPGPSSGKKFEERRFRPAAQSQPPQG